MLPYGDMWRSHRRFFQQGFNAKSILNYRPVQLEKTHAYLFNLLSSPEDFLEHTHMFASRAWILLYHLLKHILPS